MKFLALILFLFLNLTALAFSPTCNQFLLPPVPKLKLQEIQELKIGTYNVLNLNMSVGKYETIKGKRVFISGKSEKPIWQRQQVARAIKESELDIIVLQEVEGLSSLEQFNKQFLSDEYFEICLKGNDERGIEIGFLVKKNLPFHIEVDSYKDLTWEDPLSGGEVEKLFSRDLPVMKIYFSDKSPQGPPDMVLIGTHYKSQRGKGEIDPTSKVKRAAQASETAKIISELKKEYGPKTPIMLAGDFNADINKSEFDSLTKDGLLEEALEVKNIPKEERVTHTFHPYSGPTSYSQLDAIMFTPNLKSYVKDAGVYRYKDQQGNVKPIPQTYAEREQNPSDHFMMKMIIDFSQFLTNR